MICIYMEDLTNIQMYLDKLLRGISTGDIDPVVHCQVFKVNLEAQDNFTVQAKYTQAIVYYNTMIICDVNWIIDGVEFMVHRKGYPLLEMMRAILITINELKEGH